PLVGRVARRSAAKAGGVGVVVVARSACTNMDPHPQPLPTRGRGADRVRGRVMRSPSPRYSLFANRPVRKEGYCMLKTVAAFQPIGEENAFAVLARANALAAQGRDIINLGIGQPDFRTPDFIVEAAIKALRDGHHGYTPAVGIPPLREAVAADLGKRFKV